MAGISPQGVAITAGGIRRKQRSPYVDMIRGQYGQATQNVLQQRQEDQTNQQRQAELNLAKKQQKFNQYSTMQQLKMQKEANKQAGLASAIGTGITAVGTLGNLYNQVGGMSGVKEGMKGLGGFLSDLKFW